MAHYDVTAGTDTVSQAQFTEIYNSINKVFGDLYPGAVSTSLEANCATYRFGWGNRNSKQHSSKITHLDWNQLIARLNIILTHTGYTLTAGGNSVTLVTRGETIKATHYNAIADGINEILTNTVSINAGKAYTRPYYNYVSATQAELFNFTTTTREDAWQNAITTEIKLSFSDFDDVRYWHNSGADIRITPSTSGASSAAGITWAGIITKIGTYYWTIDGGNYTGTGGTIYDIGFCNLTTDYKLSFVSGAASGYSGSGYSGYSGSGYSGYSGYSADRVKIYVKLIDKDLYFKVEYMSSMGAPIDGTQSILWQCRAGADIASRGIKHHTTKPSYSIINNMTTSDDS